LTNNYLIEERFMYNCINLIEELRQNVLEVLKIQRDIFHYDKIMLIGVEEDGSCKSIVASDKKSYKPYLLNSADDLKSKDMFLKSELPADSELYSMCEFFDVHTLFPVVMPSYLKNKCIACVAINSPVPVFTDRQIEMATFSCSYIANLVNNENLVQDLEGSSERMQKMLKEMVTLHEITHALESSDNLESLLEYIMQKSQNVMTAEAASLMLVIDETNELEFKITLGPKAQEVKPFRLPIGKGISGWVAQTGEAVLIADAYSDPRFDPSFDKRSGFKTNSMLCVPMIHHAKVVGVMTLINKLDGKPFNENDQNLFTIFASQAALSIENARLLFAAIEKERLDKELQVAAEIQNLLIPQSIPQSSFLEIAAEYIPCKEVGGDFYDIIKLDENRFIFVVADVSGKGIPGALVVSNMQATLRAFLEYSNDLLQVVSKLNEAIIRQTTTDRYITFFIGLYDHSKSKLSFINAGHNPPLLINSKGDMQELKTGGIFIGFMPWEYEMGEIAFNKDDTLVMYTDGLVEAMDNEETEFEMTGLKKTIKKSLKVSTEKLKEEIIDRVNDHIGAEPLSDDFTLLISRRFA
jgi:sigma-B regulation protein RsbU (phosphoserine phosphatase)